MYRKTELSYLPINHHNWFIQYQDLVLPNPICMPLCHVCFSLAKFSCSCQLCSVALSLSTCALAPSL